MEQDLDQLIIIQLHPNRTFNSLVGVPVLRRPTGKPNFLIFFESLEDDLSPIRPASKVLSPTNIFPPRNVPVVIINELQNIFYHYLI